MLREPGAHTLAGVRAGSPVGELLRRYWMPVAAESELETQRVVPVRILGEDLVLYKDRSGRYGLLDRRCPHRLFDLAYGITEECGLRCSYHGWRFDEAGQCVEQPFEDTQNVSSTFRDNTRITAYPVQVLGGLIWSYLGARDWASSTQTRPLPLLPDWAGFYTPGYTIVSFLHVPCHWLQIAEGFYDPIHVEWLHDRWSYRLHNQDVPPTRPRHTDFRWIDFEYGAVFQRKLEGSDQWQADRTVVFPNIDGAGGQGWYLTWVVPIDDANSMVVYRLTITSWNTPFGQVAISPKTDFKQSRVPCHRTRAVLEPGEAQAKGLESHLVSQDVAAWLGLGPLVDRTRERLSQTDAGVIMYRKKLLEQAAVVANGGDPLGTIRQSEQNRRIVLPGARKNYGLHAEGLPGMTGDDDVMLRAFLPFDLPDALKTEIADVMSQLVAGRRPSWWRSA